MRRRWVTAIGAVALLVIGVAWATPPAAVDVLGRRQLTVSAPPGWFASSGVEQGRYEVFWAAAQNKPMNPEALSRTKMYRDYSVWKDIPNDRVLVRVETNFGPPARDANPSPEAAFPLDWSRAERMSDDWDFEVWQLGFAVKDIPYALVVHIGAAASFYDRAALRAAILSIRP
jgi:hypothetical protein